MLKKYCSENQKIASLFITLENYNKSGRNALFDHLINLVQIKCYYLYYTSFSRLALAQEIDKILIFRRRNIKN